jgi:Zn-dependent M28 family amino/carboxypeptidase
MRQWFAAIAVLAGCTGVDNSTETGDLAEPSGPRYITLGEDALSSAQNALAARLPGETVAPIAVKNGVALLQYDAQDFLGLSGMIHEDHHRCSGFMVHDTLADAERALEPAPQPLAVTYTFDHPKSINVLMWEIRASSILGMIRELSAFQNRYYTSSSGVQASNWLADKWRSFAAGRADVIVEQFSHSGFPQKSVIATIPGSTLANEVVVIGGHLDSISSGGAGSTAPGADDDASGIATLSEVFRVLMARDYRPRRTLKFMAYAAEEVGLVGSQAIVADYKSRGVNVVGVMQLDMTNYQGSDRDIWLMTDYTNGPQNAFVNELIDRYTGATRGESACGYACSDHASWHEEGFAASVPFESKMWEYNPEIHTPQDTLELSDNNADHAVKFARLGVSYAAELAKGTIDTSNELIREDFEDNTWTMTGLWHRTESSTCSKPGFSSPRRALYFGRDASCNYDTGERVTGTATSPLITGISATSTLRFRYLRGVDYTTTVTRDVASVSVIANGVTTTVWSRSSRTASQPRWLLSGAISLAQFAGQSIRLVFSFDSQNELNNRYKGWMIDDVVITR